MKKNVVIIILVLVIILFCGYLIFDKINNKENIKNNNEINENINDGSQESSTLDSAIAKMIINDIAEVEDFHWFENLKSKGLTENYKILIAISNSDLNINNKCSDAFDINTENGKYLLEDDKLSFSCFSDNIVRSYSYSNVNQEYKRLFGDTKEVEKTGATMRGGRYVYSNKLDSYVFLNSENIANSFSSYYYDIESSVIKGNELNIEISYLEYWSLFMIDKEKFRYILDNNPYDVNKSEIPRVYNENRDKLPHITFTYEKVDNSYILKSVK